MLKNIRFSKNIELPALSVAVIIAIFLFFMFPKYLFYIAVIFILSFLAFIVMKYPTTIFSVYIFFLISVPLVNYVKPPINFGINDFHIVFGLAATLFMFMIFYILNLKNMRRGIVYIPVQAFVFLCFIAFYSVYGFFSGNKFIWILREIVMLSMYIIPFFIIQNISLKFLTRLLTLTSIVVCLEYVARYIYLLSTLQIARVVTQQANISVFVIPFLLFSIIANGGKKNVWHYFNIAGLVLTIVLVMISLQRSLWLVMLVDLLIGIAYYLIISKFNAKVVLNLVLILLPIIIAIALFYNSIVKYEDTFKILRSRISTMTSSKLSNDEALNVREEDVVRVFSEIQKKNYLGSGLGAGIFQSNTGIVKEIIDNSFLIFIHKIGILGLFSFLFFYCYGMFLAVREVMRDRESWFMFALGLALLNYFVLGFSSSILFLYRFNIVAGVFLALIYRMSKKMPNEYVKI